MALRKAAATLFAAGTLVGASLFGSASASAEQRGGAAKVNLDCPYYFVCGQAANGSYFQFKTCNFEFQLPNLVGSGPLVNNQTAGTVARFYGKNRNLLFTSRAYDSRTVDWTPVWYVRAC
ncbi:hypothetical protein [Streptomyces sp. NPDC053048]|uniref:hypothetical protein n=1 Tax=Streptomyces sp. NPDC053048 TaxID=3365694 RepID=UPI0037D06920